MLPEIISSKPSTTEAKEAKSYPNSYITQLVIRSNDPSKAEAFIDLQNYNRDTKELSPNLLDHEQLHIADLYAEATRLPLLGQALGLVIMVVNLMNQEKGIKEALILDPENQSLLDQLAAIQQSMGVLGVLGES